MPVFANVERVLAAVAALGIYALNDVRMFHALPRDPGNGRTHALWVRMGEAGSEVYGTTLDLALRWGLAGLTLAACAWAVAETMRRREKA